MFRIISFLIWLILIIIPLVWFLNNNGMIIIIWLGYEVKIEILTFILCFILLMGIILLIYRLISSIINAVLKFFGLFKTNELKKRDKIIKKYEEAIVLMSRYIKAMNLNDIVEARNKQKQIYSLIKDEQLDNALTEEITIKKAQLNINLDNSSFSGFFKKIFGSKN